MIVDTTLFNNEFDMLDIRLELTKDYVDRWIICEGNRTMSGRPKPYYLSENIDRYTKWGNRLQVIKLDIPEAWSNWDIENGQRAALRPGYADCNDNDIIMHSDLDEVLNPKLVPDIFNLVETANQPVTCTLEMYIYRFDQKLDRKWAGNVVAKKHMFEDPCKLYKGLGAGVGHAQKRKDRIHCVPFPFNAGWHWGWMGNDEVIKSKAWSCIETQARDADQMLESFHRLDTGAAINHKTVTVHVPMPDYPEQVNSVLRQYPYWT
jgi:beta-1,4-mannosyl-glycoprotein beta-1,4-N-acetylglucosaminyltransferase